MPLNRKQAEHFVSLPLAGLTREYPNHLMHLLNGPQDAQAPSALHPIFYGCFDWHSAVHGYWLLAHCARAFPDLPQAASIHTLFAQHFTAARAQGEIDYFLQPGRAAFERPYGWAWLLKLAAELREWPVAQAPTWHDVLQPLAELLRGRLLDFLPRQRQPIRTGTHYNTAFALLLTLDYARAEGDTALQSALRSAAMRYYAADTAYPSRYEPRRRRLPVRRADRAHRCWRPLLPQPEFASVVRPLPAGHGHGPRRSPAGPGGNRRSRRPKDRTSRRPAPEPCLVPAPHRRRPAGRARGQRRHARRRGSPGECQPAAHRQRQQLAASTGWPVSPRWPSARLSTRTSRLALINPRQDRSRRSGRARRGKSHRRPGGRR